MRVLGLITARGGSKGVPGKNIKLLGGLPLIAYTSNAANDSKYLNVTEIPNGPEKLPSTLALYTSKGTRLTG